MDNEINPRRSDDMSLQNADGGPSDEVRISVAEERLVVSKREVEETAAQIRTRTVTNDVDVTESLRTERVEIERVPMDRTVATAPETRVEGGVTIIPVVEEVLVVQYRIVEEVRIKLHVETRDHEETVALRRQEVIVDTSTGSEISGTEDIRPIGEVQ